MRAVRAALTAAAVALDACSAYLLVLLGAAAAARVRRHEPSAARSVPRFAVIVPAHDEELGIAETAEALLALDYGGAFEVIVVADNCSDRTAARAAATGATVWERFDPQRMGKGHALAWALERMASERPEIEAVALVDADCTPSRNLLTAMASRLDAGARAVQVPYVVANPGASLESGARFGGYALMNVVRPAGRAALGLSCGLLGSGMAFHRDLLREHPWRAFGLAEDTEFHLQLVDAGVRVAYAPEAWVSSPMPAGRAAADVQRARWEAGRLALVREWLPRLLRRREARATAAALELCIPPQSLLLGASAATAGASWALRAPLPRRLALLALSGQAAFVIGGLVLVRAPRSAFAGLALGPVLAARNLALYRRLARGIGERGWIRTPRAPPDGV